MVRVGAVGIIGAALTVAGMLGGQPAQARDEGADRAAQHHGSVVIKRDAYGVPSIHADDVYSLYYGFGYALAEDRLFQIEAIRRAAQGRAAEVFGDAFAEKDLQVLTNYDPDTLKPQLAALRGEHRLVLDGMVAGINARIREVLAAPDTLLPKQFVEFGFKPEYWTDHDIVMAWMSQLLLRFSDYTSQISNIALLADLKARNGDDAGQRIFEALRWRDDPTAPLTVQAADQRNGRANTPGRPYTPPLASKELRPISERAAADAAAQSIALWGGVGPDKTPHSSNSWLVNGDKLVDADAVLVSGPQVDDYVPSVIWAASLHGAGLEVSGSTYAGLPYFHFGTNGSIAWGRTALAGSIVDTYQEQLNPDNPHEYRFQGKWVPMQKRSVTVRIRGKAAKTVDRYSTVHGVVLTVDAKNNVAYSKRRSWAGHEVDTMLAYYDEMKAHGFREWEAVIARKWNNQNQFYADKKGNIAYIQAGRYPLRPSGFDILLPTPGTGTREWRGFQPPSDNARLVNPESGYIANWNNRPSSDVKNTDTLLWSRLNHVELISKQLDAKTKFTPSEIWDINRKASFASEQHGYFVPMIRSAAAKEPAESLVRKVADAITDWDGQETDLVRSGQYSSPGVAAYYAWVSVALKRFYGRDIAARDLGGCGSSGLSLGCERGQPIGVQIMFSALNRGQGGTPVPAYDFLHGASPDVFIRETLADAGKLLGERFGTDPAKWLADSRPKIWSSIGPAGIPWSSPSEELRSSPDQKRGTMNVIYVFRNGEVSMCDASPPGQSGFVDPQGKPDAHYRDQLELYSNFGCKRRAVTEAEANSAAKTEKSLSF